MPSNLAVLNPHPLGTMLVVVTLIAGLGCGRLNPAFGDNETDAASAADTAPATNVTSTTATSTSSPASASASASEGVTSEPGTSDTDSDASSADSGSMPVDGGIPACGNGLLEGSESCDDGDEDNTDRCTTLCAPPTCSDGLRSGSEIAVDCGGPQCAPCGGEVCINSTQCSAGQLCHETTGTCQLPASCLDHHSLDTTAPTGSYDIVPPGDGGAITVHCEMVENGGGWTRLREDPFEVVSTAWSPSAIYPCSGYDLLGPLGAGDEAGTQVDGLGVPHTEVWLRVGLMMVDNWELDEEALFWIGADDPLPVFYEDGAPLGDQCGGRAVDRYATLSAIADHDADALQLSVGSTLDEGIADESLGLNIVEIFVR